MFFKKIILSSSLLYARLKRAIHYNTLKLYPLLLLINVSPCPSFAQQQSPEFPYTIRLTQTAIKGFPSIQSFAYATWQNKWLLVGGRIDGLHQRQPFAAFNEEGQNNFFYVVDPIQKKVWKQSIKHLAVTIREQLQSTNMQFYQMGNKLILTGGYGFSKSTDEHITHPRLAVITVDKIIKQIISGITPKNIIVQIKDERMAVAGGRLAAIDDTLILAGGHKFTGSYNPIGPDHGPGFVQEYTNEIRKFRLEFDNDIPVIKDYSAMRDTINLHRRDYNLVPQIFNNQQYGYTMYSGVFQYEADIPFTNAIDIVNGNYTVNNNFTQQFNNYHCAVLPIYQSSDSIMYSIFFGGIGGYYRSATGKIMYDKDIPFTKSISVITRHNNNCTETLLPVSLKDYTGSASEFIFAGNTKMFSTGIADAGNISGEVLLGYIVGGIKSTKKNIFWDNTGKESRALNEIISVYTSKKNKSIIKTGF